MARSGRRTMHGQVLVRLPEALAVRVNAHAEAEGITSASLVRRILVATLDADPADAQPRPRALPPYAAPPAIVDDLRGAREATGEATGAMVMLSKLAREEGLTAHHEQLEALIPPMRSCAATFLDLSHQVTQHWRKHLAEGPQDGALSQSERC